MGFDTCILVVSLSVCFALIIGLQKLSGIYFLSFQEEFRSSAREVSFLLGLSLALQFLGGPIYATLFKLIGPAKSYYISALFLFVAYVGSALSPSLATLVVFQGAIMGIGYGIGHITTFTIIGQGFNKNRALVNNLVSACNVLIGVASAPLLQKGLEVYTWRGSVALEGAIILNCVPFGYLAAKKFDLRKQQRKSKRAIKETVDTDNNVKNDSLKDKEENTTKTQVLCLTLKEILDTSLLTDLVFLTFCLACVGIYCIHVVTMSYIVRYAQDIGIGDHLAASMMSIFLATSFTCCMLVGILSTRKTFLCFKRMTKAHALVYISFAQAAAHLIPLVWESTVGYIVYVAMIGSLFGSIGALPLSIIPELFGTERLAGALGYRSLTMGIFLLVVPFFTGYLVDIVGNYRPVQYVAAALSFIGGVLLLIVINRVDKRRKSNNDL